MKTWSVRWYGVAAVLLPLLVTWFSTQIAYSSRQYPQVSPLAHLGMIVGVVAGVLLLSQAGFKSKKSRGIAFAVYIPLIVIASLLVGLFSACANGDCI